MSKYILALVALLSLAACGPDGGSSPTAAQVKAPADVTPALPDTTPDESQPITIVVTPTTTTTQPPQVGPATIAVTYYKLSTTMTPFAIPGTTKLVTVTGYCATYLAQTYCWDNGIKTLEFTDFNGIHYGPYSYSYWGLKSDYNMCFGACASDGMLSPKIVSPHLDSKITASAQNTNNLVNEIFNAGQAINVNCTESSGVLNCVDFAIDLNQAPF